MRKEDAHYIKYKVNRMTTSSKIYDGEKFELYFSRALKKLGICILYWFSLKMLISFEIVVKKCSTEMAIGHCSDQFYTTEVCHTLK